MTLSLKSTNFARKILKYNPLHSSHSHEQHDHLNQNCSHKPVQQLKPFLHLHDHRKEREIFQKSTQQKLSNMENLKSEGNEHFKQKRFKQAAHYYQKVIIYSDYTFPQNEKDQKNMENIIQVANCNLGITLMKMGNIKEGIESFQQAVKGPAEKIKIKANYCLTKCFIQQGEFKKAHQRIQQLQGFGQKTQNELKELKIQLKGNQLNYQRKNKKVYKKIFDQQA